MNFGKALFLLMINCLLSGFSMAQSAEFKVEESTFKFDDVTEGPVLKHDFIIENTGKVPLVISSYQVTCDCTSAEFPDKPILPGEKGVITVSFKTKGTYYYQDRTVEFKTNAKKKLKLRFKVYVNPLD